MIGCSSGSGIVTNSGDIEFGSSMVITAIPLPSNGSIRSFHIGPNEQIPPIIRDIDPDSKDLSFILLSELSYPSENIIDALKEKFKHAQVFGCKVDGKRDTFGKLNFSAISGKRSFENCLVGAVVQNIPVNSFHAVGCEPVLPLLNVGKCDESLIYQLNGKDAADVQLEVFAEIQKKGILIDGNILLMGKLLNEIDENDENALNDPSNYHLQSLNNVEDEDDDDDSTAVRLPLDDFCVEGDKIRYFIKNVNSCISEWDHFEKKWKKSKNLPITPYNEDILFFLSHGRGATMHDKPSVESKIVKNKFSCNLSGVISASEIISANLGDETIPYISAGNITGIWFPKEP